MPRLGEPGWYEDFVRQGARRAVASAAEACADAAAVKFPAPSREVNRRAYERELLARFERAVEDLDRHWAKRTDA